MTLNELFQRQPQRRKLRPPVSESDTEHYDTLLKTGYWGRQAAGCIFLAQDTGRFGIAHRSQAVLEPGTWGTWGGAIDSDEDPAEAVRREVAEEAGYTGAMKLIPLLMFQAPGGTFQYHNFLAVVPAEFEPRLDWETQDYRWVKWGEWPEPLHPGMRALLADRASAKTMQQYAQIVNEDTVSGNVLYHVSRSKNRKSISSLGLEPRIQEFENIKRKPGVYFLQTLEQAKDWAFWNAFDQASAMDIWEIRLPKNYKVIPDPSSEMTDIYDSWVGYDAVRPEYLKLVTMQKAPKSSAEAPPSFIKKVSENSATELIAEVVIDNTDGAGSTPNNANVDYMGLRVMMKPSVFLKLAPPLGYSADMQRMRDLIQSGGAIGAPFLYLKIPPSWEDGDLTKSASVQNHEGRHRMQAILEIEGDEPVETHLFPLGMRRRNLTPDMIQRLQQGLMSQGLHQLVQGPLFELSQSDLAEHFKQRAKPGSRPGSLKRKAGKKKGEKITASDLERLQSRANRMKKSPNADTRQRGIQLARQVSWHRNFH